MFVNFMKAPKLMQNNLERFVNSNSEDICVKTSLFVQLSEASDILLSANEG